MTKAVLLNTTGQLETTNVVPLLAVRPEPNYREVLWDNNDRLSGVNIRVSDGGTILYSKVITRVAGVITSILETDYTRNPPVQRTRTITRVAGRLAGKEVT